jgi:chromosome segregation ATPase
LLCRQIESKLAQLRATDDDDDDDDVSGEVSQIEDDLTQILGEIEKTQQAVEQLVVDEKLARDEEKPLQKESEKSRAEVTTCQNRSNDLQTAISAAKDAEDKYSQRKKRTDTALKKVADELDELKADVTVQSDKVKSQRDAIAQLEFTEPDAEERQKYANKTVNWFDMKVCFELPTRCVFHPMHGDRLSPCVLSFSIDTVMPIIGHQDEEGTREEAERGRGP